MFFTSLLKRCDKNRQRVIAVNHLENYIVTTTLFVLTEKSCKRSPDILA